MENSLQFIVVKFATILGMLAISNHTITLIRENWRQACAVEKVGENVAHIEEK